MIKYFIGPAIGAAIGYCTNYIAVKMLFYPKKEVKIFGRRLPFTPGAIPKEQPRLARAIGDIVGNKLLTQEDMKEQLLAGDVKAMVSDVLVQELSVGIKEEIKKIATLTEEQYDAGKGKVSKVISEAIVDALAKIDISTLIVEKGGAVLKEKVAGTMLQMFVNDEMIASLTAPLGAEFQKLITEQGVEYVQPLVSDKIGEIEEESVMDLLGKVDITETVVRSTVEALCEKIMMAGMDKVLQGLDISKIVEQKISQMSVDDLETLVLTVMKKELNTIVNLGALIGLLLGMFNLLI